MDVKQMNRRVIEQFRSGAPITGMDRNHLLLLTTAGHRSGREHTTPLMFHPHGDRLLIIGGNLGAPTDPDWYRNLVANPEVKLELSDEKYTATAVPLAGSERAEIFAMLEETYPSLAQQWRRVGRAVPVVALAKA